MKSKAKKKNSNAIHQLKGEQVLFAACLVIIVASFLKTMGTIGQYLIGVPVLIGCTGALTLLLGSFADSVGKRLSILLLIVITFFCGLVGLS